MLLAACTTGLFAFSSPSPSRAAGALEAWGCDAGSRILGQATYHDTLYAGGPMGAAGRSRGRFLLVDPVRGEPYPTQGSVAGMVLAVLSDGSGGWYVAGDVTAAGGLPRFGLAHVLADGAPDAWAPV